VRHLLVTNDFPPKVGGIQSYLWELWRRLPPDEVTVLTTPHEGAAAWDAEQPFRVVRSKQSFQTARGEFEGAIESSSYGPGIGVVKASDCGESGRQDITRRCLPSVSSWEM